MCCNYLIDSDSRVSWSEADSDIWSDFCHFKRFLINEMKWNSIWMLSGILIARVFISTRNEINVASNYEI